MLFWHSHPYILVHFTCFDTGCMVPWIIPLCVSIPIVGARYISMSSYQASRDDELSFVKGAVIRVLKQYVDGWWLVRYVNSSMV